MDNTGFVVSKAAGLALITELPGEPRLSIQMVKEMSLQLTFGPNIITLERAEDSTANRLSAARAKIKRSDTIIAAIPPRVLKKMRKRLEKDDPGTLANWIGDDK